MSGSAQMPLTLLQRQTLSFLRAQAHEWLEQHGGSKLNIQDPAQLGKALGASQVIFETLCDTLPESPS